MLSLVQKFPEMYEGDEAPPEFGIIDKEKQCGTACYRYGWMISRIELYDALYGIKCPWNHLLCNLDGAANSRLFGWWKEKKFDVVEYNPSIPTVKEINTDYLLIYMACNDSPDIIKSVMANKRYHEQCRACMGKPKSMASEPVWFLVGLKNRPKGYYTADPEPFPIQLY